MSVLPSDLTFYGSASMPDVDGATTGGAIARNRIVNFADMAAAGTVNYVSSSASDTAVQITVTGRDVSGVIVIEAQTLSTGTTPVAGSQSFERLLKGLVTSGTAVGDVAAISSTAVVSGTAVAVAAATTSAPATITLQSGQGASVAVNQIVRIVSATTGAYQLRRIVAFTGDVAQLSRDWTTLPTGSISYTVNNGMLFDLAPVQVTEVRRLFYNAASDTSGGSTRYYYEKVFAENNHASLALTSASIVKTVDPASGALDFALETSLGGSNSASNRQTVPASISTWSSGLAPQTIGVQGTGNIAAMRGGPQGVWLRLTLTAGLAAAKVSETMRITGLTT